MTVGRWRWAGSGWLHGEGTVSLGNGTHVQWPGATGCWAFSSAGPPAAHCQFAAFPGCVGCSGALLLFVFYPAALAAATTEPLQVCSPGMRHCPRARATLNPPVIVPVFKQDLTLCRRVCGEFLLLGGVRFHLILISRSHRHSTKHS